MVNLESVRSNLDVLVELAFEVFEERASDGFCVRFPPMVFCRRLWDGLADHPVWESLDGEERVALTYVVWRRAIWERLARRRGMVGLPRWSVELSGSGFLN